MERVINRGVLTFVSIVMLLMLSGVSSVHARVQKFLLQNEDVTQTYYHNNHLGSTAITTDEDGAVFTRVHYYPYGTIRETAAELPTYNFTGKERDTSTGLSFHSARYLSPTFAHWTQPDPLFSELNKEALQSPWEAANPYRYASNNPINAVDLDGNHPLLIRVANHPLTKRMIKPIEKLAKRAWKPVKRVGKQVYQQHIKPNATKLYENHIKPNANKAYEYVKNGFNKTFGKESAKQIKNLTKSQKKSIKSLENRIKEHQQKLNEFKKNPDTFDNKGFLKNAPSEKIRQQIIDGRTRHLENEIKGFQKGIDDVLQKGGGS